MSGTPYEIAALAGERVAVTGATGFVGRAVLRALLAAGVRPRALLRNGHGRAALVAAGVEPVVAPLIPGPDLVAALQDCTAVVHLAYDMRAGGPANLAAFNALFVAAQAAEVGRFVHASSAVVYDAWPAGPAGGGALDESGSVGRLPAPVGSYRAAKIEMERRLLLGPLPAVILQPTLVWGEGSALWTEGPRAALRRGGILLPDPCGTAALLHVDDLAQAVLRALALPDPGQERFLVSGPEQPRWDSFLAGLAELDGLPATRVHRGPAVAISQQGVAPAPAAPLRPSLAARGGAFARRLLGRDRFDCLQRRAGSLETWLRQRLGRPAAPQSPGQVLAALYAARPPVSLTLARERLGFEPRIGLREGLSLIRRNQGA